MRTSRWVVIIAIVLGAGAIGCGSSSSSSSANGARRRHTTPAPARPHPPAALRAVATFHLPAARSGIAATEFGSKLVVIGGLSAAQTSTATVFTIDGHDHAGAVATLPGPVHDAAASVVSDRLLLFGGGEFEGSNRIIAVAPGHPRQIGTLPQALSDLDSVRIGDVTYVVGGWNGTATNSAIYAVRRDGSVRAAGRFPTGKRYPAAAALDGQVVVAGGETTSGTPTASVWAFDPATGTVTHLPDLPAPIDHTTGASLDGSFYLFGGLQRGTLSATILSWRPGQPHWRRAGRLPGAVADSGAAPFDGGIAVAGGHGSSGTVSTVTLLRVR